MITKLSLLTDAYMHWWVDDATRISALTKISQESHTVTQEKTLWASVRCWPTVTQAFNTVATDQMSISVYPKETCLQQGGVFYFIIVLGLISHESR